MSRPAKGGVAVPRNNIVVVAPVLLLHGIAPAVVIWAVISLYRRVRSGEELLRANRDAPRTADAPRWAPGRTAEPRPSDKVKAP